MSVILPLIDIRVCPVGCGEGCLGRLYRAPADDGDQRS